MIPAYKKNFHILESFLGLHLILITALAAPIYLTYNCIVFPSFATETLSIIVNQNNSIKEVINIAPEGATIYLEPGTYKECQIIVNKTLTIIGKNREKTIIDGNQEAEATALFSITANHVTIKNLTLINTCPNIGRAIILKNVQNTTIEDCIINQNFMGIEFSNSNNSKIIRNQIANNTSYGIKILSGTLNTIAYNNFESNGIGVYVELDAKDNLFFNNNFKNNRNREGFGVAANEWNADYVIGGNYWKEYEEEDKNHGPEQNQVGSDGIGDKPYGEDAYPYINELKHFYVGTWQSKEFHVTMSTNASNIVNVTFSINHKTISFETEQNTTAYCRIIISKALLNAEEYEWKITANLENITPLIFSNSDFTCLYFIYGKDVHLVTIKGTMAIPEFSYNITLPMLAVILLATILACKISNKTRRGRTIFHNS